MTMTGGRREVVISHHIVIDTRVTDEIGDITVVHEGSVSDAAMTTTSTVTSFTPLSFKRHFWTPRKKKQQESAESKVRTLSSMHKGFDSNDIVETVID